MIFKKCKNFFIFLKDKTLSARREVLRIHRIAPETRIASALSCIEIFVVLYYSGIMKFNPGDIKWEGRDRFIVSKGHGAVSLYPILADLGFFNTEKLHEVCRDGSILGSIPDSVIPGIETINGSLGHGLGVACGISMALKAKQRKEMVFVLLGDGELYEGAIWEAVMFAGEHKLDNLLVIVDSNKISMLDYCKNILDLEPLEDKFRVFRWKTMTADGHDIKSLYDSLIALKNDIEAKPKILIANTIKGKGVSRLENDPLCHIRSLKQEEIDDMIMRLE